MTVTQVQPEVAAPAEAEVAVERKVLDLTDMAPVVADYVAKFNAAKEAEKQAKIDKAAAEKVLRSMLGDADALVVDGVERVRIDHRVNTNYLADVLVNGFPEAAEAARKVTPYTVIKAV